MKAILVIGSAFLETDEKSISEKFFKNKNTVSNALYERKLIGGFLNILDKNDFFRFISVPSVGWWPSRSKKIFVRGLSSNEYLKSISYLAFWRFTNFFKTISLKKSLRRISKNDLLKYDVIHIISCEAYKPYLVGVKYLKKALRNKKVFSTLIVPDLPQNIISSNNILYRLAKIINVKQILSLSNLFIDSYLCFTDKCNKIINNKKKPYLIREGIMDADIYNCEIINEKNDNKCIHCVFMGKIDTRNGVNVIIEAAKIAPPNIVFDIYGPLHSNIIDNEFNNISNLTFHGYISPSEVGGVLSNADVLLSTRIPTGEAIDSSFPSKVFEYLSYKKPIVTYKLPCYFKELDKILNYPKDTSAKSLIDCIKESIDNHEKKSVYYNDIINKYDSKAIATSILGLLN